MKQNFLKGSEGIHKPVFSCDKNMIICFSEEDDDEYELIFKDGTKYIGIYAIYAKTSGYAPKTSRGT